MRLVSFDGPAGPGWGALVRDEYVVDLALAEPRLPATLMEALAGGPEALALAARAANDERARRPLTEVHLRAPVPAPGKIVCVGLNYRDHAAESGADVPAFPTVFAKYANTVAGPEDPIVLPPESDQVDYEGELGVIIGRRTRRVATGDALGCVAGYVPFNDVSARDWQHRTSQWTLGKSFDGFAPMGPALVTADEVPDPQDLRLEVRVGGEVLQSSNTSQMIFSVAEIIAEVSSVMTLLPGDVIATGTPSGVGAARTPPRFLVPGDVVEVEIGTLGVLRNHVIAEVRD